MNPNGGGEEGNTVLHKSGQKWPLLGAHGFIVARGEVSSKE
jgi:hypothetical protein